MLLPVPAPEAVRLEHLHAVVSRWFDRTTADHHGNAKGYTVSPLRDGEHGPVVEIGIIDDPLTDSLLTRAAPGTRVRLGRTVLTLPEGPRQLAATPWTGLLQRGGRHAWCLRFDTPLTFRRGNRFTPLPAPTPILGSLRATWRNFAPASVGDLDLDLSRDPVWVTDIDGTNEVCKVNGLTVSGFVGRVRIACDAADPIARSVDQAIGLAPFSGVGAYTTRGFGVTRIESGW
ncbi:CRISPR system precrRNA processing endoribonuclease RAMP protein Cas6 [Kutzneria buriramensis]|uniref:CRISPR system precrRNA processing endoribonuclease RAMP protein Cas6 n=1 Tax=Kutzneria buriramensis TaxID=1045776 RepID=UPI001476E3DA|nr:CRISPR system precrRNA processing endoribonuclease RAMP protein Cas6 [Kutzneria buriramensis]